VGPGETLCGGISGGGSGWMPAAPVIEKELAELRIADAFMTMTWKLLNMLPRQRDGFHHGASTQPPRYRPSAEAFMVSPLASKVNVTEGPE